MNKYDKLKQVIKQSNPEKDWGNWDDSDTKLEYPEPIRLADVLLAAGKNWLRDEEGRWIHFYDTRTQVLRITALWNLRDDNLDHQSEETKQSLIDLLV